MKMEESQIAELLIASSPEGVLIVDKTGEIILVNESLINMFGYDSKKELLGKAMEVLIPRNYQSKHGELRSQFVQNPEKRRMGIGKTLFGLKKDGTQFPVEIGLNHIKTDDGMLISALVTDITRRVNIENQLTELNKKLENKVAERTRELENAILELQQTNHHLEVQFQKTKKAEKELSKALEAEKQLGDLKSRFVSMASHEFRTPLSTILSSNTLISKHLEKENLENPEKINRHIVRIEKTIQNLNNILEDLLSLGKLAEGKVVVNNSDFVLTELLEEINEEMTAYLKEGQHIMHDLSEKSPININSDKQLLHNILLNLISNASKYSDENCKIWIGAAEHGDHIIVEISDEGIGIPESDQKHLFDRFFRAANVTNIQGTGLGLNIVKNYVELLGGSIAFSSEENVGSTFKITLNK